MGVGPRRQAHPLTPPGAAHIVSAIDTDTAIGFRDRAVTLLGYASSLRPGEISGLDAGDIVRSPPEFLSPPVAPRPTKTHAANLSEWPEATTR